VGVVGGQVGAVRAKAAWNAAASSSAQGQVSGILDFAFALAADESGGGMQEPVAQGFGFGVGQRGVQAEQS
jgi:hypothetical protein